ncbi:unnamed protein product [Effrenium voratum]|uniref:Uncharacterized protein n=1 Tax=Effrenium voratum TaxID=2562239 RepID=A0AA36HPV8_9DINO|nr:unnamed protein product [Effrenium voratum]
MPGAIELLIAAEAALSAPLTSLRVAGSKVLASSADGKLLIWEPAAEAACPSQQNEMLRKAFGVDKNNMFGAAHHAIMACVPTVCFAQVVAVFHEIANFARRSGG